MPLTSSDTTNHRVATLTNAFYEGYYDALFGQEQAAVDAIATDIPITGDTLRNPFLGDIPGWRDWVDVRAHQAPNTYSYSVTIDHPREVTVEVARTAQSDDQTGQLRGLAANLGRSAIRDRYNALIAALLAGDASLCYDGQFFFDTDHPQATLAGVAETVANYGTTSFSAESVESTVAAMKLFRSTQGNPLSVQPNLLICGPKLEWRARRVFNSTVTVWDTNAGGGTLPTASDNVLQGLMQIIVSPNITGYDWFLVDTSHMVKPLLLVHNVEDRPEINVLDVGSQYTTLTDMILLAGRDRYKIGYGLWQFAYYNEATS